MLYRTRDFFVFVLPETDKFPGPTSDLYEAKKIVLLDFEPETSGFITEFANHAIFLRRSQCRFY